MTSPRSRRLAAALAASLVLACTPGTGDPSGTYQAKNPEGSITIEFKREHKFHMTMQEGGSPAESADGDYLLDGNKITLQVPGGMPLVLVRNGKVFDASMMGQVMHFEKK